MNSAEFLKKLESKEIGLAILEGLRESILFIECVLIDCTDDNIAWCYYTYIDIIIKVFEIDTLEIFKNFFYKIKKVDDLTGYEFMVDTIKRYDNIVFFDLKLKGKCEVILPVKAIVFNNNEDELLANIFFI